MIIILAPNLLAMSNYIAFGSKILLLSQEGTDTGKLSGTVSGDGVTSRWMRWLDALLVKRKWIIPTFFFTSDIICIIIQGIAGGLLSGATTLSEENSARNTMLVGLGLQLGSGVGGHRAFGTGAGGHDPQRQPGRLHGRELVTPRGGRR